MAADRLLALYLLDTDAGDALARLPWIADELSTAEWTALQVLLRIAAIDPATAQQMTTFNWVTDAVTDTEEQASDFVLQLAEMDLSIAQMVVSFSWLADSLTATETVALESLLNLVKADASIVQVLVALPWLADDVTEVEQEAVHSLTAAFTDADSAAFARLVAAFPWMNDDVTLAEQRAVQALLDLRAADPVIAQRVRIFPWVVDGITDAEQQTMYFLARIAETDRETARKVSAFPWLADGASSAEMVALGRLRKLTEMDVTAAQWLTAFPWLAETLLAFPWLAHDIDVAELGAVRAVALLAETDEATARVLVTLPWIADGLSFPEMTSLYRLRRLAAIDTTVAQRVLVSLWSTYGHVGQQTVNELTQLARVDVGTAQHLAGFAWLGKGHASERQAMAYFVRLAKADTATAQRIAAFSWLVDAVTSDEMSAIGALTELTETDLAFAQRVVRLRWVGDDITRMESRTITELARTEPETARALLAGIGNASSPEAVALLFVLTQTRLLAGGLLYDHLLESHFIQAETVSLPLAGQVNLWVIQTIPSTDNDDLPAMMEDVLRASEEFMGSRFPANDVVLVVPAIGIGGGPHWGTFSVVPRYPPNPTNRDAIYSTLAYHYFRFQQPYSRFGPPWLVRGAAEFVRAYTNERVGLLSLEARKPRAWRQAEDNCLSQGLGNIQRLNQHQERNAGPPHPCNYILGEHFLLSIHETLGSEATSAALREIVYLLPSEGRLVTEEAIYRAFLRNTPPDLVDAFHEVYDRLHGGPRPD